MEKSKARYKHYRPMSNGKYITMGKNDIGKRSIPLKDRCEDFDKLWHDTFIEVMKYWEHAND